MDRPRHSQITAHILLSILLIGLMGCTATTTPKTDIYAFEQEASKAYAEQDYERAAKGYEKLVEKIPKDAEFWFRLANSYAKSGQSDKAINAYQNTLMRDSSYAKAWYNMGMIQMQQALRSFIDLQETIPPENPVHERANDKIEGLFKLLGNPDKSGNK